MGIPMRTKSEMTMIGAVSWTALLPHPSGVSTKQLLRPKVNHMKQIRPGIERRAAKMILRVGFSSRDAYQTMHFPLKVLG